MIKAFIFLRIQKLYRGFTDIGLARGLFLVALLAFLGLNVFQQTKDLPNVYYVVAIFLFIITHYQLNRQDKQFLKTHFSNFRWVLWVEYLLLSVPVLMCLFIHFQWIPILILQTFIGLIVYFDYQPRQGYLFRSVQEWIPDVYFEWKGEIRKLFFFIGSVWISALGTSFFIGSVPIAIFLIGMIPLSFTERNEPYQMLIAPELSTNKFLLHKIKGQFVIFSVIIAPLILAFMFFHYEKWYIPIGEYFILINLHTYLILTKYTFYKPNSKSAATQIFSTIGAMGAIIPIFLPVLWLLCIRFYFKSRENLNFYLNDFN